MVIDFLDFIGRRPLSVRDVVIPTEGGTFFASEFSSVLFRDTWSRQTFTRDLSTKVFRLKTILYGNHIVQRQISVDSSIPDSYQLCLCLERSPQRFRQEFWNNHV